MASSSLTKTTRTRTETVLTNFRLPADVHARLRTVAAERRTTMISLVVAGLERELGDGSDE